MAAPHDQETVQDVQSGQIRPENRENDSYIHKLPTPVSSLTLLWRLVAHGQLLFPNEDSLQELPDSAEKGQETNYDSLPELGQYLEQAQLHRGGAGATGDESCESDLREFVALYKLGVTAALLVGKVGYDPCQFRF